MCGIAGILRLDRNPNRAEISQMVSLLAHRGPDGEGVYVRDSVALGHRRLSIIDLEGGRQPLSNEDDSVWITFNGEIYNYQELRSRLESLGHRFKTDSDTEVIVHAYEQWGFRCVEQLRGMFAFCIADFVQRHLFIARDHFGIKPLFVRQSAQSITFSSELRALSSFDGSQPEIDPQAIEYFLRYKYIPQPSTIYRNVSKLSPGHYQVIGFDGKISSPERYWKMEFSPTANVSTDDWLEEFHDIFRESVKAHLVADVPFGAFLSGGVDSTLVAMEMSRILDHPVTAYTIGFDEEKYSEVKFAREAAQELGIDLRAEIVDPDVVSIFDELIDHYGEPFADTSALPTWCVSKLARSDVPMVLSGDGGDEFFAGYHRYETWAKEGLAKSLKRLVTHPRPAAVALTQMAMSPALSRISTWETIAGVPSRQWRRSIWKDEFQSLVDEPCPAFWNANQRANGLDRVSWAQSVDIETYLPGDILTKVDIASMCHGLEVRTPLTDVRVAEFAATLPMSERRCGSDAGSGALKVLPKKALMQRFSRKFVHRNKMGFGIPEREWLQKGSAVRNHFDQVITDPNIGLYDYLDYQAVQSLVSGFDTNKKHTGILWSMFVLGTWLEGQKASRTQSRAA